MTDENYKKEIEKEKLLTKALFNLPTAFTLSNPHSPERMEMRRK
jgi:hypothetical protein